MKRVLLISLSVILLFVACSAPQIQSGTPPEIVYGEDVCDRCGMIIEDERFAAGLVIEAAPQRYEHRIFDDIGGMLAYASDEANEATIASYFVHDYISLEWIDATTATFVRSETLHSPMGYGLAAFSDMTIAEAQAQAWQGEVLTFREVEAGTMAISETTHNH